MCEPKIANIPFETGIFPAYNHSQCKDFLSLEQGSRTMFESQGMWIDHNGWAVKAPYLFISGDIEFVYAFVTYEILEKKTFQSFTSKRNIVMTTI